MRKRTMLSEIVKEIIREDGASSFLSQDVDNTPGGLSPEQVTIANVMGEKYKKFVTDLNDEAGDYKVQATLKAGLQDGEVDDDKIDIKEVSIAVKDLRPTQNEIDVDKSLSYPLAKDAKLLKDYLEGKDVVIMAPIITLNEKWVIDGHHRWSQVYAFNANATMKCADMKFPGLDPIRGLKAIQTAIAAVMGEVPQKFVKGTNLLKADEDKVKADIVALISKGSVGTTAMKTLKKFNKIKSLDPNEAADYVWQQVEVMQTNAKPATGAPERGYMPQTDEPPGKFDDLEKILKKGVVNWNKPF